MSTLREEGSRWHLQLPPLQAAYRERNVELECNLKLDTHFTWLHCRAAH